VKARKKRIIVSVINDLATDQRVAKVCDSLHQAGFEIILVGRKLKTSMPMDKRPYSVHRMRLLFTQGPLFYLTYNIRLFFFLFFHKTDILWANDLDTLLANTKAKFFKRKCKLIYDSHEYFTAVPELANSPLKRKIWKTVEKCCVPFVNKMITVNSSIADLYEKEYKKKLFVVRNIPSKEINIEKKSRKELKMPEEKKILIVQGSGINMDRGIEELVEAMQAKYGIENTLLYIIGGGDVLPLLKAKVKEYHIEEKVIFIGKLPYVEMMQYTMQADYGLTLDKDTNLNYKFSLPNKLFDYMRAGIPIIASNLIEIATIIRKYELGFIADSHKPDELATIIKSALSYKEYEKLKQNTKKAMEDLNWENEEKVLEKVYGEYV